MKTLRTIAITLGLAAIAVLIVLAAAYCPSPPPTLPPTGNMNLEQNINAANGNLANTNIEFNKLVNEFSNAVNEQKKLEENTNGAKNATNGALGNVGAVHNKNFNGTSLTEAEKARCRFKWHEGCP